MTILRWFISARYREAINLRRHVRKLYRHQKDILSAEADAALRQALDEFGTAIRTTLTTRELRVEMARFQRVANKWLKTYPHASARENVEMLLVALAVAMAIRTFWLQPFKIPTGSMQPTLFGVTSNPDYSRDPAYGGNTNSDFEVPDRWTRFKEWFQGVKYLELKAKNAGTYDGSSAPLRILIFTIKQTFYIGGQPHTVWFPPDGGAAWLGQRAGIEDPRPVALNRPGSVKSPGKRGLFFNAGDTVMKIRVRTGDHLFVNRFKYNFRKPDRGEIIVFSTTGIDAMPRDYWNQFYIKRLIGLGGETVRIGNDRHVTINDTNRLDAGTPHFEFVYGFNPDGGPENSQWSGHVNGRVADDYGHHAARVAPLFPDEDSVIQVPDGHLIVMGDNTLNSLDGRSWGTFDERKVIGNASFVYWPLSERFGWGFR